MNQISLLYEVLRIKINRISKKVSFRSEVTLTEYHGILTLSLDE